MAAVHNTSILYMYQVLLILECVRRNWLLKTYHQQPSKIQGVIFCHRTEQQECMLYGRQSGYEKYSVYYQNLYGSFIVKYCFFDLPYTRMVCGNISSFSRFCVCRGMLNTVCVILISDLYNQELCLKWDVHFSWRNGLT